MNPSAVIPLAQMILSWTLLGVLCAWLVFCAFLALRPQKVGKREAADVRTLSGAMPVIVSPIPHRQSATPVEMSFSGMSAVSSESVSDVGSPVA
jgi:hypothetical protein